MVNVRIRLTGTKHHHKKTFEADDFTDLRNQIKDSDFNGIVDIGYGVILSPSSAFIYVRNASQQIMPKIDDDKTIQIEVHVRFRSPTVDWDVTHQSSPVTGHSGHTFVLGSGDTIVSTEPLDVNVDSSDVLLAHLEEDTS